MILIIITTKPSWLLCRIKKFIRKNFWTIFI